MYINYKLIGKGEKTVLFLHGWGANLNSFLFFKNANLINSKMLFIDFAGFGESEKLSNPFDVFDHALQVFKLLKQLQINNISIVCHSFGGRIAITLETMFNVKVDNLVLIGSAGIKPKFSLVTFFKIRLFKFLKIINKIVKIDLSKFGSADYKMLNNVQKTSFKKIVLFNQKKYLKSIKSKTLIVWGRDDNQTPLYMAKIFNKKIAGSKLVVLQNCNHFCYAQKPQIVLFEVANFLNLNV